MGNFRGMAPVCHVNQHCTEWARLYLKYCLCSTKDGVSLTLGLVSVLSWGVAEVPQIVTNCREKSTEGLSVAFLVAWILGDIFNLFGCILEPSTLPTQYYMAVLYAITSSILLMQTIYYGHIYHRLKTWRQKVQLGVKNEQIDDDSGKVVNQAGHHPNASDISVPHSSPIPVGLPDLPCHRLFGRDSYYKSARFLSRSHNSPAGSFLPHRATQSTIDGWNSVEEPLLGGGYVTAQSAPPSKTKTMLCLVSVLAFFFSSFNLRIAANNRVDSVADFANQGVVIGTRRALFQVSGRLSSGIVGEGSSSTGTLLGWGMAAIYMGGRLPQICLNIKRGNVKGLSPGMFIFALIGNGTYIASILVNSLDWSKLQPNLPWLVDAGGCALLDTCILFQFLYFRSRGLQNQEHKQANLCA